MGKATTYTVPVPKDKAGLRLDRFLSDALPALSRSRLKVLIETGMVARQGAAQEAPGEAVRPGVSPGNKDSEAVRPGVSPGNKDSEAVRPGVSPGNKNTGVREAGPKAQARTGTQEARTGEARTGTQEARTGEARTGTQETVTAPAAKVKSGEVYAVTVPAAKPATPRAEPIPLEVAYEDDDLIVIDKPPGLVVHPAAGHPDGTLVNALLAHCGDSLSGIGGVLRPGIVHRLDKGTSGLMVVAKNDEAHRRLAAQLEERKLTRAYKALVWGRPDPRQGRLDGAIGRNPRNRKKMAVVEKGGKPALTRYRVLAPAGTAASLVECLLATGRTHQIRVHMANLGHPVVGDPLYGGGSRRRVKGVSETVARSLSAVDHQALHAYLIAFVHPATGRKVQLESDLPRYFRELSDLLEKI